MPEEYEKIYKFVEEKNMAIFYRNNSCEQYNKEIAIYLSQLKQQKLELIHGSVFVLSKESYYNDNKPTYCRTIGGVVEIKQYRSALSQKKSHSIVPYEIPLFIGARVMLLKNINTEQGLVNGRRGTVNQIIFEDRNGKKTTTPYIIEVRWDKISDFEMTITDVIRMKVDEIITGTGKKIEFYQFPIKLCYAITAHKAQGQTLSKCAICVQEEAFAHGALYVAISRVRKIDDLILFGPKFPYKGPWGIRMN